jgi:GYF domain 2
MQIYIARPGGQKEGPFTVDQINRDLAAKRYRESDYWAWHEGLPQWMPLHAIPGILSSSVPAPAPSAPEPRRVAVTPESRRPVQQPRPQPASAQPIPDVFMRATPPAEKKSERVAPSNTDVFRKANPPAERKPTPGVDAIPDVFTKATPHAEKKSAAQTNTEMFRKANPPAERKPAPSANPIADVFTKATPPAEKKPERVAQPSTDVFKRAILGGDRTPERAAHPAADVFSKVNSPAPSSAAPVTPQPAKSPAISKSEDSSGLPFNALEQIFIFTSGEGRNVFQSVAVAQKMQEVTGEALGSIRGKIPVSVVGRVDVGVEIMLDGVIPEKAWRAMFAIKPAIAQKAKEDQVQICVRTFSVESQDSVALFLLYSKEKLQLATA